MGKSAKRHKGIGLKRVARMADVSKLEQQADLLMQNVMGGKIPQNARRR